MCAGLTPCGRYLTLTSVLDRLRSIAHRPGMSFQLVPQLFRQEESLRMLAALQYVRSGNDHIIYDVVRCVPIAEGRQYIGVRVQLVGRIGNTVTPFHIDGRALHKAVFQTLQRYGTTYGRDALERIRGLVRDAHVRSRWSRLSGKTLGLDVSFEEVMDRVRGFLIHTHLPQHAGWAFATSCCALIPVPAARWPIINCLGKRNPNAGCVLCSVCDTAGAVASVKASGPPTRTSTIRTVPPTDR